MATYQHNHHKDQYSLENQHYYQADIADNEQAQHLTAKRSLNRTEIAKKAAKTRLLNDPDAFKKMGSKGGKARHEEREKDGEDE